MFCTIVVLQYVCLIYLSDLFGIIFIVKNSFIVNVSRLIILAAIFQLIRFTYLILIKNN